jgi:predicted AlkP superfamily phosphohydrolase/phosphomutase
VHGIVQPGEEYEALCRQLVADLSEVKNAESGEPLAVEIFQVRDHYSGPNLDKLPDILMSWNRSHPINAATSEKIGIVDKTGLCLTRSGDHRPFGRFFAVAPDWPVQRLNQPVKVQDFAPTIAELFSISMGNIQGKPIAAMRAHVSKLAAS